MDNAYLGTVNHLVYLVGRTNDNGSVQLLGTCFLLDKAGLYATAAHVTGFDDRNLLVIDSQYTIHQYQDTTSNFMTRSLASIYAFDPIRDICILKCNNINRQFPLGGTDQISIGRELCIVGYPHCTSGRRVLTYQKCNVGAKVLIETAKIKSKHLILNIQTRPGQSGSPIIDGATGLVFAMVLGAWTDANSSLAYGRVDPSTLHQTTHAISAEYITKMIT